MLVASCAKQGAGIGGCAMQCFAQKHVADMNRHQPWVIKDPRMALVMPLWRKHIHDLVCVFVHKDPIKNSISLASNPGKSNPTGAPHDVWALITAYTA